jgi:polyphosphate kinase
MSKYKFFDRELSWLSFNHRVLQEAKDPNVPLHEKIKFMAIFSSNLDEFFRVRVASLRYLMALKRKTQERLNIDPGELLTEIQNTVDKHQQDLGDIFRNSIIPELQKNGIILTEGLSLNKKQLNFIRDYFQYEVLPYLRPSLLVRKKITIFLQNKAIYFAIKLQSKNEKDKPLSKSARSNYAVVEIPTMQLPRFIELPNFDNKYTVIFLDDIIKLFLDDIFPGYLVKEVYAIKLTRDAQMYIEDEFTGDLLQKIKKGIARRNTGAPSRFLYDQKMPPDFLNFLVDAFMLEQEDLVPGGRYHNFSDFISFPRLGAKSLQDKNLPALRQPELEDCPQFFTLISEKDILLLYPYHIYNYVIRLIKEAADDPFVREIFITLYRCASDSQIIKQLIQAVMAGKSVTAFIEVKARFDEESNILWATHLEDAGIKVLYSFPGLKVHAKMLLITRREDKRLKQYAYLSTGNFNEKTAKLYSDFGFFTADNRITREVKQVFAYLQKKKKQYTFRHLLVAPFSMRNQLNALIDREIESAKSGLEARIDLKLNSLEDSKIIEKLYQASNAGVKIRIIVRGICCLLPGVKNLSENIRIISIVDRFLEHGRVLIFHNKGREKYFLASADWMHRNLSRRIEVVFPIYDKNIRSKLRDIFELQWQDNLKARQIDDIQKNEYNKKNPEKPKRSQIEIYEYLKGV